MDIPRIFNITESAHRIHNPITPEKLATLGAALRLEPGARVLDLGAVRSIPAYNVMGLAKASLEANVRFLAADLGAKNIRVKLEPIPGRPAAHIEVEDDVTAYLEYPNGATGVFITTTPRAVAVSTSTLSTPPPGPSFVSDEGSRTLNAHVVTR